MSLTRDEVGTIQDEHSAARAWLELQHERERPAIPQHRAVENRAATEQLERDWPQASAVAARAADHELGGLSPSMKRTRDAHRQRAGVTSQQAARARTQRRRPSKPAASSPRTSSPRTSSPRTPAAGRPAPPRRAGGGGSILPTRRQTRVAVDWAAPGALSYGQMAWQTLGWAVGLSMLYLFLTKGTGAVQTIANGVTNGVTRLVNPLADPLTGHTGQVSAQQRGSAGGVPVLQPGESGSHFDQRLYDYLRTRQLAGAPNRRTTP